MRMLLFIPESFHSFLQRCQYNISNTNSVTSSCHKSSHSQLINMSSAVTLMVFIFLFWVHSAYSGYVSPMSSDEQSHLSSNFTASLLMEIEELKQQLIEERTKRVTALLLPPNLGEAELLYYDINNKSIIHPITEGIYGDQYFEGLTSFSLILHSLPLRLQVYQRWMTLMEDNEGDLLSGGIIVLRKLLENDLADPNNPSPPPPELVAMKVRVEIYTENVLKIWAINIQNEEFESVIDFGSPSGLHMIGDIFDELLPQLIAITYTADGSHFVKVMKFIQSLRWNKHKYTGLAKMIELVTQDDFKMVVVHNIKESMLNLNGPDPADMAYDKFLLLKQSLPLNLQHLLWHRECLLKNLDKNEYLYADTEIHDADNRKVFTLVGTAVPSNPQFQLVPQVFEDHLMFNIINKGYCETSYFDGHTTGADGGAYRKHVSLRKAETPFNWKVTLGAGSNVQLYHETLQGYLVSEPQQPPVNNKRSAYIWTEPILMPQTLIWTLECVS